MMRPGRIGQFLILWFDSFFYVSKIRDILRHNYDEQIETVTKNGSSYHLPQKVYNCSIFFLRRFFFLGSFFFLRRLLGICANGLL